jgi:alcohol dehydrogenase class IV
VTADFVFEPRLPRVVLRAGALAGLADEVEAAGIRRALVLTTPGQSALAERATALLGGAAAGRFAEATMHVPRATVDAAMAAARAAGADGTVALGGGSTTGLAKALALEAGLPFVAVPTTYAGSEATTMFGITEGGAKRTGRDRRVLPRAVLYDPELSLGLPFATTAASALNALAHAAEGLYAPDGNALVSAVAEEGVRILVRTLPRLLAAPRDVAARSEALQGAWLCGVVMGHITVGLHHKLCHVLGGTLGLPHAETHAVVLPHALAYNAVAAPEAMRRIAAAAGGEDAPRLLFDLAVRLGHPRLAAGARHARGRHRARRGDCLQGAVPESAAGRARGARRTAAARLARGAAASGMTAGAPRGGGAPRP